MPQPPSPSRARARAACRRHLAVPTGIPSDRAISATGRSSTWWRTRIIRSCGRRRSKARAIASLSTISSICRSGVEHPAAVRAEGSRRPRSSRPNGHLAQPDPMPARHQRGVRDDPVEPAVEGRRIAQARKLSPGRHERVLGGVGRVGVVGQDRPGETVAAIDPGIDEGLEGRRVAGASAPNERVVGRRRRVRCCRHRIHVTLGSSIVALACSRCRRRSLLSGVQMPPRGRWLGRRQKYGTPSNPGRADGIYRAPHLRSPERAAMPPDDAVAHSAILGTGRTSRVCAGSRSCSSLLCHVADPGSRGGVRRRGRVLRPVGLPDHGPARERT